MTLNKNQQQQFMIENVNCALLIDDRLDFLFVSYLPTMSLLSNYYCTQIFTNISKFMNVLKTDKV